MEIKLISLAAVVAVDMTPVLVSHCQLKQYIYSRRKWADCMRLVVYSMHSTERNCMGVGVELHFPYYILSSRAVCVTVEFIE